MWSWSQDICCQPAALLHLAVDDMSSVKIRLVVKNILCPRRPGPRCSPPAEDVGPGRRVVRRRVQSIPILCKWKVSKGAAGGRYLCGDNAAPCAAQHQTMGLRQYRDGDSSCFRRYSDNLSLCILRFVSCGVNNQLRGAAHFKHVSFLHDMMAIMPIEAQTVKVKTE